MNQNYLAHYGIQGMKWGVRRTLGRPLKGASGKGLATKKSEVSPKPKHKSISEMSDDELRSKLNRINMEKQYRELLASTGPVKSSTAKKVAIKVLELGILTLGKKGFDRIGDILFKAKT